MVCFGLTAERAKLIASILNVAAAMHHIVHFASTTSASIDERLDNEIERNRRNNEEKKRCERLLSEKENDFFCFISHLTNTGTNAVDFCV